MYYINLSSYVIIYSCLFSQEVRFPEMQEYEVLKYNDARDGDESCNQLVHQHHSREYRTKNILL